MGVTSKMLIPPQIVVGFQEREDTYTGKLAYVIYTDTKGVLRKEKSWNSWRDDKIPENKYKNEPTSGFVLNKGVGGTRESYGWNARNEYIRVYDPRGFEFEISVANLLFILQECTSTKGKGLEGEFVYSWSGSELVLLPVSSQEYKECFQFTENQGMKVTKKDMVEGCLYQMKDMKEVMYLGKHSCYEPKTHYEGQARSIYFSHVGDRHIFAVINGRDDQYLLQTGFTRVAKRVTQEVSSNFSDYYENFIHSLIYTPPQKAQIEKVIQSEDEIFQWGYWRKFFVKENDNFYIATLRSSGYYVKNPDELKLVVDKFPAEIPKVLDKNKYFKVPMMSLDLRSSLERNTNTPYYTEIKLNKEEYLKKDYYKLFLINDFDKKYLIDLY